MANTIIPQNNNKTLQNQTRSEFTLRPQNGVGQDRSASLRDRTPSPQASQGFDAPRARRLDKNSDRVKKHSTRRQTVQAIGWIPKPISLEIDRIAAHSGQTRSRTIATLLEEGVHQRLHVQHAVMLAPLVRKAVAKAYQPMLSLLTSIAYDTNQTRNLTGNILAKMVAPEDMEQIREKSAKKARDAILHQRPQITELVEAARDWFASLEEGEADPS